jgi:serine/threonine protein kinase
MAKDIVAGMAHLHKEGIVHRDLAARNLLLNDELVLKITDFGLARTVDGEGEDNAKTTTTNVGPLRWMVRTTKCIHLC